MSLLLLSAFSAYFPSLQMSDDVDSFDGYLLNKDKPYTRCMVNVSLRFIFNFIH